jgi:hypothetical protein
VLVDASAAAASRKPRAPIRARRWLVGILLALLLALIAAELVARFYFGLGDPPLMIADDRIEYLFKPNQDCRRFGNRVRYNGHSMRSDDFAARKSDPRELRVLVLGDSVVNGGVRVDQDDLATSILQRELRDRLKRPVVVGNVGAQSWGPANMLAYAQKFGLFEADVIVIVLNSNDSFDVPTYQPLVGHSTDYPARKPPFALAEVVTRYVIPRLRYGTGSAVEAPSLDAPKNPQDVETSLNAVRELIALARSSGARHVIVGQFLERAEARPGATPKFGHREIAQAAIDAGAEVIQLGPSFTDALERGSDPYQPLPNLIHPNELGQRLLATDLLRAITARLDTPTTAE